MRLQFCGVRGSTPAPGAEFVRVGGHTSCVAVWPDDGDVPVLALDAGTGLQRLSDLLNDRPFRGTILVTHLHWDHTHGLPFFRAGDRADARVRLLMPDQGIDPVDSLSRAMSPPHFPIGPRDLDGDWSFTGIQTGDHVVEGFDVAAFEVPHKGGRTFGYRVSDDHSAVAYLPDHLPRVDGPDAALVELLRGVDVLIHDAQFTEVELAAAQRFGHATVEQAAALAQAAGIDHLVLFHHAPGRTDEQVDDILDSGPWGRLHVTVAIEGQELSLPTRTGRVAVI